MLGEHGPEVTQERPGPVRLLRGAGAASSDVGVVWLAHPSSLGVQQGGRRLAGDLPQDELLDQVAADVVAELLGR